MCFAYWITKATNTHSQHVLLAFTQQRLQERASMLRLYVPCLSLMLRVRLCTLKRSRITCVRRALLFRQPSFKFLITGVHESELSAPRNEGRCGILKKSSVGLQKRPKVSVTWHPIHDLCINHSGFHKNTDVKIISCQWHSFSHEPIVSLTPKRRPFKPNLQNPLTVTSADVSETTDYIFPKPFSSTETCNSCFAVTAQSHNRTKVEQIKKKGVDGKREVVSSARREGI
jgi:hypothetical protein